MFVFWLADELGLTDPESLISRGAKIFSEVLAREGVIGDTEYIDCVSDKNMLQQYRQPVWKMFQILCNSSDNMDNDDIFRLLIVCRALIYMDDPKISSTLADIMSHPLRHPNRDSELSELEAFVESNWQNMVNAEPPLKAEPTSAILDWVQSKYCSLGCTNVVVRLVCSTDQKVSLAAIKFGSVLLEGGNRFVQDSFLDNLKNTSDDSFFATCSDAIHYTIQTLQDRELLQEALQDMESLTSRTTRMTVKLGMIRDGPALDALPEEIRLHDNTMTVIAGIDTIRFLQLLAEGHHAAFQSYLREQPENIYSHNLLQEVNNGHMLPCLHSGTSPSNNFLCFVRFVTY